MQERENRQIGVFDIQLAVNKSLKETFPKVNRQAGEVKEGFRLPSFFVQVQPLSFNFLSEIYRRYKVLVSIKYFSQTSKSLEVVKIQDQLRELFGLTLKVRDRVLKIKDISSFMDEEEVMTYQFNLDFVTFVTTEDDREPMKDIHIDEA